MKKITYPVRKDGFNKPQVTCPKCEGRQHYVLSKVDTRDCPYCAGFGHVDYDDEGVRK